MENQPPRPGLGRRILFPTLFLVVVAIVLLAIGLPNCIVEGTLVETPSGSRRVEELEPGDEIWTHGPGGERRLGRVVSTRASWSGSHLEIVFTDGGVLRATGFHPIATREGWRRADGLSTGDEVRGREGWRKVESVGKRWGMVRVYDLEVEPDANFFAAGVLVHNKSSVRAANERIAQRSLAKILTAQADFRSNDRDGNQVNDFWIGDVAQLYFMKDLNGNEIHLIENNVAMADAAPVHPRTPEPTAGYLYAVVRRPSDGTGDRSEKTFAVCAWPADYPKSGRLTFIASEEGTIYSQDLGRGERLLQWPADLAKEGWGMKD